MLANLKVRKCILCKHWFDQGASNIKFRQGAKLFDYNQDAKKMCLIKKVETGAIFSCPKFESKF